ncbi:MAG: FAD-dependent oxidoreductase [Bryobacterales bacterium]|nr:FAD-dependent oxidoreductase [Bryobacterales bacterium]
MPTGATAIVVGAGAFGGWTALALLRAGCRSVKLVDAWGPGHSRSSSGDETRVIRGCYGPNAVYTQMVARALPMWRENEARWGVRLLEPAGALWMAGRGANDAYERAAVRCLREAELPYVEVSAAEGRARWPQMNWDGIEWAVYEPEGGFLYARRACEAVMRAVVAEGGEYVQRQADVTRLADLGEADHYVIAGGPWLGSMFPEVARVTATRQEAFYFGTPAGDARFDERHFPAWVDNSAVRFYGIPGNEWRGFKAAMDVPGAPIDPTTVDRTPTPAALARVREFLARRFPALADAPLVEHRVCQYEMSPDGDLIVDRHPARANVWLVGGGSGHGFKLGPVLGAMAARTVLGLDAVRPEFALARWAGAAAASGVGERK